MNLRLLELNFAQLSKNWSKSKNNRYSDRLRQEYHDQLDLLFTSLKREDFSKLDPYEIEERSKVLEFFFHSITFLDNSTLSNIPFEIVKCLEIALKEWSMEENHYIIVTSLVKDLNGFSFNPVLTFNDDYYRIISTLYQLKFNSRLIQINVPDYLAQDYLANVVLYHELGHFIDLHYNFSSIIVEQFCEGLRRNETQGTDFYDYFPYLKNKNSQAIDSYKYILRNHVAEYLCDLFACQYVDNCLNYYLEYIAQGSGISQSHPATSARIKMVEKFLEGRNGYCVLKMNEVIEGITNFTLSKKYTPFTSDDFINFLPVSINHDRQLHFLFKYGWVVWLKDWKKFRKTNNMGYELTESKVYNIINNLIEKSIGNFIISNNWTKINVSSKE